MILNMSGGGPGLNFDIVGGTSAPSSPKSNTIWVNTSTAITGYMFSATQPSSPINGVVWISVGTYSSASFNALKKEYLMVYPLSAKQYVSGAWVDKTAKIYQNGKWVDWWDGELYYNGNQYTSVTGGFTVKKSNGYFTFGNTTIPFGFTGNSDTQATMYTSKKIDLRGYTKLCIDLDVTTVTITAANTSIGLCAAIGDEYPELTAYKGTTTKGRQTLTLDISQHQGTYYVAFKIAASAGTIYKIWLE